MVLLCGLLIFLLGLVLPLSIPAERANRNTTKPQQAEDNAPGLPTEVALKDQPLGKSEQEAKDHLGSPSRTEPVPSKGGATELWYYQRQDGKLAVTIQDGRAKDAAGPE